MQEKRKSGTVVKSSTRIAKSGNYAHEFFIQNQKFSIFSEDELSPIIDGDIVQFDYITRKLKSGRRNSYNAVVTDSFVVHAPSGLDSEVNGHVYVLSNPSMPNLLKVGFTTTTVDERVIQLSNVTSVPTKFKLEWSFPVLGNPHAVEQRTHARLSKHKSGKEFFKTNLETAKNAVISSFSELYPEKALQMESAFSDRAKAELERKKNLAQLAENREKERKLVEEQEAFERSREGRWLREGTCRLILKEFDEVPNVGKPSILGKMFGKKYRDYLDIQIVAQHNSTEVFWQFDVSGRLSDQLISRTQSFKTLQEAFGNYQSTIEKNSKINHQTIILAQNNTIKNPPDLPDNYQNPRVVLDIDSFENIIFEVRPNATYRKKSHQRIQSSRL